MSEKSTLSLQLAQEDIERVIRETIKSQVAAAFAAQGGKLAEEVVSSFLFQGVDYNGRPTGHAPDRGQRTYVNKVVAEALRDSMRSAVVEWIQQNEEKLRKVLVTQLNRRRSDIANQLIASLVDSASDAYRFSVSLQLGIPRES